MRSFLRLTSIFVIFLLVLSVAPITSSRASAQANEDCSEESLRDRAVAIMDCIGGEPTSCTTTSSTAGINNKAYNGAEIFNAAQLESITANQPFYQKAADRVKIPWQLIAVIHNMEYGLKRDNPANGQGAYQLYSHTNGGKNANAFLPAGPISDEEFQRQTDIAADIIAGMAGSNKPQNSFDPNSPSRAAISNVLYSYNSGPGGAGVYDRQAAALGFNPEFEGYEGSPYVMNKVDEKRDPNTAPLGTWGQIKTDGGSLSYPSNQHFGGWVQYAALAGVSCTSGGPFIDAVVRIAEQELNAGGGRDMQSSGEHLKYIVSGNSAEPWCADFVSWVFNEAGSPFTGGAGDGGWQIPGVLNMMGWFQQNGEYHPARSGYTPRVGDVVIYNENMNPYPQHVNIVVAVNGDMFTTIGGNETNGIRKADHSVTAGYVTGFGTKK